MTTENVPEATAPKRKRRSVSDASVYKAIIAVMAETKLGEDDEIKSLLGALKDRILEAQLR